MGLNKVNYDDVDTGIDTPLAEVYFFGASGTNYGYNINIRVKVDGTRVASSETEYARTTYSNGTFTVTFLKDCYVSYGNGNDIAFSSVIAKTQGQTLSFNYKNAQAVLIYSRQP